VDITLKTEVIKNLSYRGILAYVAVGLLGDGEFTTAVLASEVGCNSSLMLEGIQELCIQAPLFITRASKMKWSVGTGVPAAETLQILESDAGRRAELLDDLKKYWDWANPNVKFTMNAADGRTVVNFLKKHKDWDGRVWRHALRNRCRSEINHSQKIYNWLPRLEEYLASPLDRYGKPMQHGVGGKLGQALTTEDGNRAAREAALAAATDGR
jgi:hypothetical protein